MPDVAGSASAAPASDADGNGTSVAEPEFIGNQASPPADAVEILETENNAGISEEKTAVYDAVAPHSSDSDPIDFAEFEADLEQLPDDVEIPVNFPAGFLQPSEEYMPAIPNDWQRLLYDGARITLFIYIILLVLWGVLMT